MNAQTEALTLQGAAGAVEVLVDRPAGESYGTVVVSHPHPLFQGTMHNKVVQTLVRAFVQSGWTAVRFNFRGVGASAGVFDQGIGETEDLLHVVQQLAPTGRLALAGFSFGAFVTARAVEILATQRALDAVVLVGTATSRFQVPAIPTALHPRTLVVHGEVDDVVPLSFTLDWARQQALPVTVIPGPVNPVEGVGHFFHGQLTLLKNLVQRHILTVRALAND